jgi:hypothetical protein
MYQIFNNLVLCLLARITFMILCMYRICGGIQMSNNNAARIPLNAGIAIGPILFVVAILAVLVGAIAAGSGGFGSSTADEAARVRASTIIQQAVTIKAAFDRIVVNGTDPLDVVVAETGFTATSLAALYGTAGGGITIQNPPREAVAANATWRFVPDADLPDIGAAGDTDFITVIQVTQQTCNALNDLIFGRGVYTTPPSLGTTPDITITAAATGDTEAPTANEFALGTTPSAAFDGRTAACGADGTDYYFYQLLAAG